MPDDPFNYAAALAAQNWAPPAVDFAPNKDKTATKQKASTTPQVPDFRGLGAALMRLANPPTFGQPPQPAPPPQFVPRQLVPQQSNAAPPSAGSPFNVTGSLY